VGTREGRRERVTGGGEREKEGIHMNRYNGRGMEVKEVEEQGEGEQGEGRAREEGEEEGRKPEEG
jgi:hypothetical protein